MFKECAYHQSIISNGFSRLRCFKSRFFARPSPSVPLRERIIIFHATSVFRDAIRSLGDRSSLRRPEGRRRPFRPFSCLPGAALLRRRRRKGGGGGRRISSRRQQRRREKIVVVFRRPERERHRRRGFLRASPRSQTRSRPRSPPGECLRVLRSSGNLKQVPRPTL